MYKLWPSPLLFFFAAVLVFRGCQQEEQGQKFLAEHPPGTDFTGRINAESNTKSGHLMQIGGGIVAAAGAVLLVLGLIHRQVQTQALRHRLVATYTFVPLVPTEGIAPDGGLLTEDQAADLLRTRYPSLARKAAETLRKEFADKRRLDPTKIWYVKDFQVTEVPPASTIQSIRRQS